MTDFIDRVVMVDGRDIRVQLTSGSQQLVVLTSGCSLGAELWRKVIHRIPGAVLTFDRPGLGGTSWRGQLPTLANEVDALADLIEQFGEGRPAIVVAHSMAGFHGEALARVRPDLVVGLIMVDASVEPAMTHPKRDLSPLARLSTARVLAPFWAILGGEWWARHHGPEGRAAAAAEWLAYRPQAADLVALRDDHAWPGCPVTVITAQRRGEMSRWVTRQADYAASLGGTQLVARSGHNVMLDRPDVILDTVADMRRVLGNNEPPHALR